MSGVHPSLGYSQFVVGQPSQHHDRPTQWWVWFVGGAIAVSLGIGGAMWFANKKPAVTEAPVAALVAPTTTTTPIEQPAHKLVELKFDSLPSGGVFADGRSAELCRTPCSFNVDLGDGGPSEQRTFVVRADGYADSRVVVDFIAAQRNFSVSLARQSPTVPTVGDTGSGEPVETVDLTGDNNANPGMKKKGRGKTKKGKVEETVEETVVKPPEPPPEVKIEKTLEKPVKKIDRTDTIDPFKR
jgi:hypothetical protein